MKVFGLIFSLYLLTLAALPCVDVHNNCTTESIKIETQHDNHSTPEHHDACSPLCTCGCCGNTVNFSFQKFRINDLKPGYSKTLLFPLRDFFFSSNYSANIWQPPKMVV